MNDKIRKTTLYSIAVIIGGVSGFITSTAIYNHLFGISYVDDGFGILGPLSSILGALGGVQHVMKGESLQYKMRFGMIAGLITIGLLKFWSVSYVGGFYGSFIIELGILSVLGAILGGLGGTLNAFIASVLQYSKGFAVIDILVGVIIGGFIGGLVALGQIMLMFFSLALHS